MKGRYNRDKYKEEQQEWENQRIKDVLGIVTNK